MWHKGRKQSGWIVGGYVQSCSIMLALGWGSTLLCQSVRAAARRPAEVLSSQHNIPPALPLLRHGTPGDGGASRSGAWLAARSALSWRLPKHVALLTSCTCGHRPSVNSCAGCSTLVGAPHVDACLAPHCPAVPQVRVKALRALPGLPGHRLAVLLVEGRALERLVGGRAGERDGEAGLAAGLVRGICICRAA